MHKRPNPELGEAVHRSKGVENTAFFSRAQDKDLCHPLTYMDLIIHIFDCFYNLGDKLLVTR